MTVREIAKRSGVCPAAVSRVLNEKGVVKPETREKVMAVIQESGYVLPPKRREKKRIGQNLIVVLLPRVVHSFFNTVLDELHQRIARYHKRLIVVLMDMDHPTQCLDEVYALNSAGIILLEEGLPDEFWEAMPRHIPTVMCGALSLNQQYTAVHIDDLSAAYDMTNYLVGLGHRSIAFIAEYPDAISSGFQRITGFRKALEDQGLRAASENIVYVNGGVEEGYRGMMQLLEQSHHFTAVLTCSDEVAVGALAALQDKKIQVPEDISVMGFDDCPVYQYIRPQLTTLHQPIAEMVERSLQILTQLKPGTLPPINSITFPHRIVERGSCKKI